MEDRKLIIALTKADVKMTSYVIIGTLEEMSDKFMVLSKVASPTVGSAFEIVFEQHIIPQQFLDFEELEEVKLTLGLDSLAFFVELKEHAKHPICVEYKKFWSDAVAETEESVEPELVEN